MVQFSCGQFCNGSILLWSELKLFHLVVVSFEMVPFSCGRFHFVVVSFEMVPFSCGQF